MGLLGLLELFNWIFHRKWKWLPWVRWPALILLLFYAQGQKYFELASKPVPAPNLMYPSLPPPVLAENPDHARLETDLIQARAEANTLKQQIALQRQLLVDERNSRAKADAQALQLQARVQDLEKQLQDARGQKIQCDRLTDLLATGRKLPTERYVSKEEAVRMDAWCDDVCRTLSRPQCEAFLAVSPQPPNKGWPLGDYERNAQTLRGRVEYLASMLARECR